VNKLLIYIGENQKFNHDRLVEAICSMPGVIRARNGSFIGAIFQCEYTLGKETTVVRVKDDLETITVEGLGHSALGFSLELVRRLKEELHAVDMDYSFNVKLVNYKSIDELDTAIRNGNKD
jgi:hypothetical protein